MRFLVAALLAAAASARRLTSSAADPSVAALDDDACTFSWKEKRCSPAAYCSFQYQFGDTTFSQSCRLLADEYGRLPQQLHLAYAGAEAGTGMTLSWTTYSKVADASVWIGTAEDSLQLVDQDKLEMDVRSYYADAHYELFNYHATVSGLQPATKYFYKVGSASAANLQSSVHSFSTARAATDTAESFTFAMYGDLGVDANALATIAYVTTELPGKVDFIYHVGDISYADNAFLQASELFGFFYEETFNRWMNSLTPAMQTVPYMVSVGNHEAECHSPACFVSGKKKDQLGNYRAYNARFKMPSRESGGVQNMWYAFDHGPLHFTSISSETDYENAPKNSVTGRTYGGFGDQLKWLEEDLKKADANRASVPWLVVSMHRAIYSRDQCDADGKPVKLAATMQKAFEALFLKYKVDVVVAGHLHLYERQLPIKEGVAVLDGVSADRKTYSNPQAPVYVVTGAAGNTEGHGGYDPKRSVAWNAVIENKHYGINLVDVAKSQLTWKFVASDNGDVLDEFTIVRK